MKYSKSRKAVIEAFKKVRLPEKFIEAVEKGGPWDTIIDIIIKENPEEIEKIKQLLTILANHKDPRIRKIVAKINL